MAQIFFFSSYHLILHMPRLNQALRSVENYHSIELIESVRGNPQILHCVVLC